MPKLSLKYMDSGPVPSKAREGKCLSSRVHGYPLPTVGLCCSYGIPRHGGWSRGVKMRRAAPGEKQGRTAATGQVSGHVTPDTQFNM